MGIINQNRSVNKNADEFADKQKIATSKKIAEKKLAPKSKKFLHKANFRIGEVVKHRFFEFRGVIFDVDHEFSNTEEWWNAIPPSIRPRRNQPFYHLLAVQGDMHYTAYVSEQNLIRDGDQPDVDHPLVDDFFDGFSGGVYRQRHLSLN